MFWFAYKVTDLCGGHNSERQMNWERPSLPVRCWQLRQLSLSDEEQHTRAVQTGKLLPTQSSERETRNTKQSKYHPLPPRYHCVVIIRKACIEMYLITDLKQTWVWPCSWAAQKKRIPCCLPHLKLAFRQMRGSVFVPPLREGEDQHHQI
jgi:hypothetical protein